MRHTGWVKTSWTFAIGAARFVIGHRDIAVLASNGDKEIQDLWSAMEEDNPDRISDAFTRLIEREYSHLKGISLWSIKYDWMRWEFTGTHKDLPKVKESEIPPMLPLIPIMRIGDRVITRWVDDQGRMNEKVDYGPSPYDHV